MVLLYRALLGDSVLSSTDESYIDRVTPPFATSLDAWHRTRLPGFARSLGSFVDRGVSSDERRERDEKL